MKRRSGFEGPIPKPAPIPKKAPKKQMKPNKDAESAKMIETQNRLIAAQDKGIALLKENVKGLKEAHAIMEDAIKKKDELLDKYKVQSEIFKNNFERLQEQIRLGNEVSRQTIALLQDQCAMLSDRIGIYEAMFGMPRTV